MTGLKKDLPWQSMSAQALEELTYALVEEMGAVTIEWRSSSAGINTSDGGRDIEAKFVQATPDGDSESQVWWLECKRREGSVSPTDIKEAVINSAATSNVKVLILVTNSHFTNPTRDWVSSYNQTQKGPVVKLWDRRRLQSLVENYPSAAAKSIVALLDLDKKIEFLTDYFYESSRLLSENELRDFWNRREQIKNAGFLVAASYADICTESIHKRPWMAAADEQSLALALVIGFTALVPKHLSGDDLVDDKVIETIGYIINTASVKLPANLIQRIFDNPHEFTASDVKFPSAWRDLILKPSKMAAAEVILERCADDCARYSCDLDKPESEEFFWSKFLQVQEPPESRSRLILINHSVPCAVGLDTSEEIDCPLTSSHYLDDDKRFIDTVSRVIRFRDKNPSGQYLKYSPVRVEHLRPAVDQLLDESE